MRIMVARGRTWQGPAATLRSVGAPQANLGRRASSYVPAKHPRNMQWFAKAWRGQAHFRAQARAPPANECAQFAV
jgi:hypothetical protein